MPGQWILIGAMTITLTCAVLIVAMLADEAWVALVRWRRRLVFQAALEAAGYTRREARALARADAALARAEADANTGAV